MKNGIEMITDNIADAFTEKSIVQVKKSEYAALLRESETLRIITDLLRKETFLPEDTIKAILGIGNAAEIGVASQGEPEPAKGV